MPAPKNTTKTEGSVTAIQTDTGGVQVVTNKIKDFNGYGIIDKSYLLLQNSWKTFIKIFHGNIYLSGKDNISINAGQDVHITGHNIQATFSGGKGSYTKGTTVDIKGVFSEEESAKRKQLSALLDTVTKASQEAMKNTAAEKVVCANCAQTHLVDDKSDNWSIVLGEVDKRTRGIPYLQGPFAVLRWLINHVYVALLGSKTNLALNNGKGCGPGCEAGLRDGMSQKLQAGDNAAKEQMDKIADEVNKLTADMASSSASVIPHKDEEHHIYGDIETPQTSCYVELGNHHSFPMNLRVSDALRSKLRVTTEGNCKVVTYQPPKPKGGNLMINIQNNFKLSTGNAGMDILSTGEIAMKGGSVHINGSQGEVSLTSKNLTTIGGANVLIAADNKSGDSGVSIDAKSTYVRGAFNVNGDTAMLGGLTLDGALSVNYINCPSMRSPSTLNGDDNFVTHHANWQYSAGGLNASNLALKLGAKYLLQKDMLMLPTGILELFLEHYNLIMMTIPLEVLPTGCFWGWTVGGGFGVTAGTCAGWIWNYPHNHTVTSKEHTHETDVPNGGYWKKASGAGQARAAGNAAPTPAPTNGTFPRPGPRSWSGGCGGGGLYSKVRNQRYGINSDDAFNGGNYVTTTTVRNPDGSIYPPPDLTYRTVKDYGKGVKVSTTGTVSYPLTGINC